MKAMLLKRIANLDICTEPLELVELPIPILRGGEILIKVSVCGVCHTELDEIEGRTAPEPLPVVLGHQAVGRVEAVAQGAEGFLIGQRVGVAWIHSACGFCTHCQKGNENLCPDFKATGRDVNGGYAEYMTVPSAFAYAIPDVFSDAEAAPLLCAGAIGYRSLRLAGLEDGQCLGLTGFGASAHLVLKMVRHRFPHVETYVFARNAEEQAFALDLGANWAGSPEAFSPQKLDSIIDTTPVWNSLVEALKNLRPGGRLVVNAIRKEEADKAALLRLDYPGHLWMEKEIKSVANVSRADVREFLALAAGIPLRSEFEEFRLEEANRALLELKTRRVRGAKVLRIA